MPSLEKELLKRIKLGDDKAFEDVFKGYYSTLCVYASYLLNNNSLAEEAVQETLIRIWENRSKLNINGSLKSYLYKSIHNHCINTLKHMKVVKNNSCKYTEEVKAAIEIDRSNNGELLIDMNFYDRMEDDLKKRYKPCQSNARPYFI